MKNRKINKNRKKKLLNNSRFIYIEGETEENYINKIKNLTNSKLKIKFKIKPSPSFQKDAILNMLEEAKELSYLENEIFFVYDIEDYNSKGNKYKIFLNNNNTLKNNHIYLSNPCIEYFILLHYKEFNNKKLTTQKQAINVLKKINPAYEKASAKSFNKITIENVNEAIDRSLENFIDYSVNKNYSTLGKLLKILFDL